MMNISDEEIKDALKLVIPGDVYKIGTLVSDLDTDSTFTVISNDGTEVYILVDGIKKKASRFIGWLIEQHILVKVSP